jgi:hypothetical protein
VNVDTHGDVVAAVGAEILDHVGSPRSERLNAL